MRLKIKLKLERDNTSKAVPTPQTVSLHRVLIFLHVGRGAPNQIICYSVTQGFVFRCGKYSSLKNQRVFTLRPYISFRMTLFTLTLTDSLDDNCSCLNACRFFRKMHGIYIWEYSTPWKNRFTLYQVLISLTPYHEIVYYLYFLFVLDVGYG